MTTNNKNFEEEVREEWNKWSDHPTQFTGKSQVEKADMIFNFFLSKFHAHNAEVVGKMEKLKCKVPENTRIGEVLSEENVNKAIVYAGRFNYNKGIDDVINLLQELK